MKFSIFVVCFALIALNSSAASFDCNKASNRVERTICGTTDLSGLDDELATQYKRALERNASIRQSQRDWLRETRNCETTSDIASCLRERYVARIAELKAINQQTTTATPTRGVEVVDSRISVLDGVWQSDEPKIGYTIKNGNAASLRDTFFGGKNIKKGEVLLWLKPLSVNSFVGEQMFADGKFHPVTATLSTNDSLTFANAEHGISWTVKRRVESNQSPQAAAPPSSASNTGATSKMNAEQQRMYDACANELMANYSPSQQKVARSRSNSTEAVGIQYICSQKVLQEQRRIDEQNGQAAESERIAKAMAEQRIMQQKAEAERNARYVAEQEKSQQNKERQLAGQRLAAQSQAVQTDISPSARSADRTVTSLTTLPETPIVAENKQSTSDARVSRDGLISQLWDQIRPSSFNDTTITAIATIIIIAAQFGLLLPLLIKKFKVIVGDLIRVGQLEFQDAPVQKKYTVSDLIISASSSKPQLREGYYVNLLQIGDHLLTEINLSSKAAYEFLTIGGSVSAVFSNKCKSLEYIFNHSQSIEIGHENSISGSNYFGALILVFISLILIDFLVFYHLMPTNSSPRVALMGFFIQCGVALIVVAIAYGKSRSNLTAAIRTAKTK